MKKVLFAVLLLATVWTGVACLDVTPYPVLDAGAAEEAPDADLDDAGSDG